MNFIAIKCCYTHNTCWNINLAGIFTWFLKHSDFSQVVTHLIMANAWIMRFWCSNIDQRVSYSAWVFSVTFLRPWKQMLIYLKIDSQIFFTSFLTYIPQLSSHLTLYNKGRLENSLNSLLHSLIGDEKLLITEMINKYPAFSGTLKRIIVHPRARHWPIPWARRIPPTTYEGSF
jgi:hypothetical protein